MSGGKRRRAAHAPHTLHEMKILVSQPKPASYKSPYYDIARDFGVELVFRPFIKVQGITPKEFRRQRVNLSDYTAVVFTSRHAIDNFFLIAKEMRVEIPDTMKYFCVTEHIALYIQKYKLYRKRKVFSSSTGKITDLVPIMAKYKSENFLVPISDANDGSVSAMLNSKKLKHKECIMYRTVSNDFTDDEIKGFDYDLCVFFSPSGINTFKKTFGNGKNSTAVATFGPATGKAAHEAGLNVIIEAPSKEFPSMASALRNYLLKATGKEAEPTRT